MKTFKQLREETQKIKQERLESIRRGVPVEFSPYLSVGHDPIQAIGLSRKEEEEKKRIMKDVYGIHPDEAPLPHLWAAGPHIKTEKGESVSIRPLTNPSHTHAELFPEAERSDEEIQKGVPHKYYVGGRVDHSRKTISMTFGPISDKVARTRFSSSYLDRVARTMREKYPGYSLVDLTMGDENPRVLE